MTIGDEARTRRRAAPLLVRRTQIDASGTHAGDFAALAVAPRFMPAAVGRTLGHLCVDTTEPVFGLTYDDGPHPTHTPEILDVLASHGAQATFFVLTRQALAHPEIVRRAATEGHEIALHGRDHRDLLTMSAASAWRELHRARAELTEITGVRPRLYRPPYLRFTAAQALVFRALGLQLGLCSGDSRDWVHDDERAIADRALAAVFPGAILLMHDMRGDAETASEDEELPHFDRAQVADLLLRGAAERGLAALSVGELLDRHRSVSARTYQKRAR